MFFSYWYYFHIQGTNNSDIIKEEIYDTAAGFVLLASNVLLLISSIISLIYIHVYLKLNVFLKVILYQMTILGILGSAIIIVAVEIILATSKQSFVTCSLIYYPFVFMGTLIVTMTSMISGLRYVICLGSSSSSSHIEYSLVWAPRKELTLVTGGWSSWTIHSFTHQWQHQLCLALFLHDLS